MIEAKIQVVTNLIVFLIMCVAMLALAVAFAQTDLKTIGTAIVIVLCAARDLILPANYNRLRRQSWAAWVHWINVLLTVVALTRERFRLLRSVPAFVTF